MTEAKRFKDIMRPPDIDACKEPMRAVIRQLQDQGFKGRHISLALLEVLAEVAHEDSTAWANKFYRILRDMGADGVAAGRYISGWQGPESLRSEEQH